MVTAVPWQPMWAEPGSDTEHQYFVFGLRVRSAIPLPELAVDAGDWPDAPVVRIAYGDAGPAIVPSAAGPIYVAGLDTYRHEFPGVARYLVRRGADIIVAPCKDAPSDLIRAFLLGTGLAVLCHQRGLFPLHASAIETDGRGVAFAGPSGAGKSTLLQFFHRRGHRALADDVCVFHVGPTGEPQLWPGVPRIKLAADGETDKTEFRVEHPDAAGPLTLGRLYVLPAPDDADGRGISRVRGSRAFEAVFESTFRPHVVGPMGRTAARFEHCRVLSTRTPVFDLGWRRGSDQVRAECERLEAHITDWSIDER